MHGARPCQCLLGFRWRSTEFVAPYQSPVRERKPVNRSFHAHLYRRSNDGQRARTAAAYADYDSGEAIANQEPNRHVAGDAKQRRGDEHSSNRRHQQFKQHVAKSSGASWDPADILKEAKTPRGRALRGSPLQARVIEAIGRGGPHDILSALDLLARDGNSIQEMPQTLWTEVLRALAPRRWILHTPNMHNLFMIRQEKTVKDVLPLAFVSRKQLLQILMSVLDIRRHAKIALVAHEYQLILLYASQLGSSESVRRTLTLMRRQGFEPGIDDWKNFAFCILHEDKQRRWATLHSKYRPLQDGQSPQIWKDNVVPTVRAAFGHMLKTPGNSFDTEAYCIYMLAMARDGEFDGINRILQELWGLDTSEQALPAREIEMSALVSQNVVPNQMLLLVIAEVFGAQNRVLTSYRLIDYLCNTYGLQASADVWTTLLFWTWAHARLRAYKIGVHNRGLKERHERENDLQFYDPSEVAWQSQLITEDPMATLEALITTVVDEGNLQGNAEMNSLHVQLLKQLDTRRADGRGPSWENSKEIFEHGEAIHAKYLRDYYEARRSAKVFANEMQALPRHTVAANSGTVERLPGPRAVTFARQTQLQANIAAGYVQVWACNVLETYISSTFKASMSEENAQRVDDWWFRGTPDFIRRFYYYLPKRAVYWIEGGKVELNLVKDAAVMGALSRQTRQQYRTQQELMRGIPQWLQKRLSVPHRKQLPRQFRATMSTGLSPLFKARSYGRIGGEEGV